MRALASAYPWVQRQQFSALKAFGAKRIAVLTPHQPRGDDMVRLYLTEAGYEIIRLVGLKCATPRAIAQVPETVVRNALKDLDGPDVDAIVQVGTALPTVVIAAEAERWLGKPVLAINAVTYWDVLRQSGIDDRVWLAQWLYFPKRQFSSLAARRLGLSQRLPWPAKACRSMCSRLTARSTTRHWRQPRTLQR